MEPIRTARLVVRPFRPADLADFLAYQSDPDVRRYLPGEPQTPDEAAGFLAKQSVLDDAARETWHDWAIEHQVDRLVIGNIGAFLPANDRTAADVGFQLHPAYHGRGLASEAAGALVAWLRDVMQLTRITASCDEANVSSARLLLGLGMTEVASLQPRSRTFELMDVGGWVAPSHRRTS